MACQCRYPNWGKMWFLPERLFAEWTRSVKSTASRSTRIRLFLSPHVLRFLLYGPSGNRSRKLPGNGKEDGIVRGVGQDRRHRLGQRNDAGRTLETAGSTSDLKSPNTEGLQRREIYAIASLRETNLQ